MLFEWQSRGVAALCGALVVGCDSTGASPAADAAADGLEQTADATETDRAPDDDAVTSSDTTLEPADAPADATAADGGGDAGGDAASASRLLVPGSNLSVGGLTSDGYIIYYGNDTQTYYAESLAGGPPTVIAAAPLSDYSGFVFVIGRVAFAWSWNNQYVGTLTSWTAGMTEGVSLTTAGLAYRYQTVWVSEDSKHVAYIQTTSDDASVSSIYGANVDGTGATQLLANVDTNASFEGSFPSCFPRLVFRGDAAVISYCTAADAGLSPQIQAFSIANGWVPTATIPMWVESLQYNAIDEAQFTFPFAVDPEGTRVAAASASSGNGALQVFPLDGGPGTLVDPGAVIGPGLSFAGSPTEPWSLLYNNDAGALDQAYGSSPMSRTLVDVGVNYLDAFSTDGQWLLVSSALNGQGWFSDLSLVSTQSPGAPVLVASSTQYGGYPVAPKTVGTAPRGFTTDNAYAVVMTNLGLNSQNQWIGNLRSMPVTPPYTTTLLTNTYVLNFVTLRGSEILVGDNFLDTDGGSLPSVDLDVVDPAGDGGVVTIARGIPGDVVVSSDLTQAAYVVSTGPAPGIYVSPLP